MTRRPSAKIITKDMIFEEGARSDLEHVLAQNPRTLVMVWEDDKTVHCLSRPHTRGVIAGVLMRVLQTLKLVGFE